MLLITVMPSGKGKPALEFKAWDMMGSLGFTSKELTVQDSQKSTINDTKFRSVNIENKITRMFQSTVFQRFQPWD